MTNALIEKQISIYLGRISDKAIILKLDFDWDQLKRVSNYI